MKSLRRTRRWGIVCLVGAVVQIAYGLLVLAVGFYDPDVYYGWDEGLWAIATVGMIGGTLGLLALDVGRPHRLAVAGATISVTGNLVRILASALLIVAPSGADSYTVLILLSIGLLVVGLGMLGVATLRGRRLSGGPAWLPLIIAGCALVITPTYSISLPLHFFLLGLWGVPWLLLGVVIVRHSAGESDQDRLSSPTADRVSAGRDSAA